VRAEEAFNQYHRAVYRFVCRLTRRADLAEDITQECFLAYIRAPGKFDEGKGSLRTYLYAIARNLALKHLRDRAGEEPLDRDSPHTAGDPRAGVEAAAAVEQAVAKLPVLEREALILFQYEGFTLAEIAAVVDAEVGTVKARLHRARERLRVALAPWRRVGECHERE
jgi:RNA polymerase sigma-70 factor (ECF subfamily)